MLPPASWKVLLAWAMLSAVVIGLGTLARRVCRAPAADGEAWLLDFWTGWAALTVVLEVWHLVLPIDTRALAFVAAVGVLALAAEGARPWRALARAARSHPLVLAAVVVAALWLSRRCLAGVQNGDSGFYHIPIMRWLASYPAVPGLVNLFPFLAYNQSFFLYATVLDVPPLSGAGTHLANGFLVLGLLARACLGVARALGSSAPSPSELYYALLLPPTFGLAFDINLTSPSPDVAVFVLEAVLSGTLVCYLVASDSGPPVAWLAAACALLAAVGVTVKLSCAGLAAAALPLVLAVAVRRAPATGGGRRGAAVAVVVPAALAIVPWVLHGVILSGYPLYPSPSVPLPVDWRAPLAATISQAAAIREWNGVAGAWRLAFSDPRWFAGLLRTLGWTQPDVLLPLALALVAIPVAIVRRLSRRDRRAATVSSLVLVPTVAGLLFSFVAAPQARFAGALPWVLAAQSILLAVGPDGSVAARRSRAVLAAGAIALTASYVREGPLLRADLVDFEPNPRPDFRDVRLPTGLMVRMPVSTDQCWDTPPPCTPAPNPALRLRREGDLAGGFSIDPALDRGPP